MSEKAEEYMHTAPSEPDHELSHANVDDVLVTVYSLAAGSHELDVEDLLSAVYGVFPVTQQAWSIPPEEPRVMFIKPPASEHTTITSPRFYYRNYLVPFGPALRRLTVNYYDDLSISSSGLGVNTTGTLFERYCKNLGEATDIAIRTDPFLGHELAQEIIAEPSSGLLYGLGRNLDNFITSDRRTSHDDDGEAYRVAFESAWAPVTYASTGERPQQRFYPYEAHSFKAEHDQRIIASVGLKPVAVSPLVNRILQQTGAFPPIFKHAEGFLRSAPRAEATERPSGIDILERSLKKLFPDLSGDFLSLRRYEHSYPLVMWDEGTRSFVMSIFATHACKHGSGDGNDVDDSASTVTRPSETAACLCWVGLALHKAVSSWRSKNRRRSDMDSTAEDPGPEGVGFVSDQQVFHVLMNAYASAGAGPIVMAPPVEFRTNSGPSAALQNTLESGGSDREASASSSHTAAPQGQSVEPPSLYVGLSLESLLTSADRVVVVPSVLLASGALLAQKGDSAAAPAPETVPRIRTRPWETFSRTSSATS